MIRRNHEGSFLGFSELSGEVLGLWNLQGKGVGKSRGLLPKSALLLSENGQLSVVYWLPVVECCTGGILRGSKCRWKPWEVGQTASTDNFFYAEAEVACRSLGAKLGDLRPIVQKKESRYTQKRRSSGLERLVKRKLGVETRQV